MLTPLLSIYSILLLSISHEPFPSPILTLAICHFHFAFPNIALCYFPTAFRTSFFHLHFPICTLHLLKFAICIFLFAFCIAPILHKSSPIIAKMYNCRIIAPQNRQLCSHDLCLITSCSSILKPCQPMQPTMNFTIG